MSQNIKFLQSADYAPWNNEVSVSDNLPVRMSGPWIETKHRLLTYYADIFASGMKSRWEHRVYIELFSGPGRCRIRTTGNEELGSPLKVIGYGFTKFIFTEINVAAAKALAARLSPFPNAHLAEIWCGDCAEMVKRIVIPQNALSFAFIDPTGISHAPFSLIKTLHQRAPRCDLLINVQHGMGIKMNLHQYTPDSDEQTALTRFLGSESWKSLLTHNRTTFFRGFLELYKGQLDRLGYSFVGHEVLIRNGKNVPMYLLLYASKHPRGQQFWEEARRRVLQPELPLG